VFDMEKYDSIENPPAPYITVRISNPVTGDVKEEKGLIDTGSFKTAIPETWVDKLNLVPADEQETRGYKEEKEKRKQIHHTYFVDVTIKGHSFPYTEVLAVNRKKVLIGRDILNQLKLVLDGKNLTFEILDL